MGFFRDVLHRVLHRGPLRGLSRGITQSLSKKFNKGDQEQALQVVGPGFKSVNCPQNAIFWLVGWSGMILIGITHQNFG